MQSLEPESSKIYACTDSGNGERFAAQYRRDVRYCHPQKLWYYYTGTHWRTEDDGWLKMLAKETARRIYREALNITDEEMRKTTAKWALGSESELRKKAMLASAQSEPGIPVLPEQFDSHLWYFNALNVTLDLKDFRELEHDREHLITKLAPVSYDPSATCPRWERFLREVMDGNDSKISFLRRAVGYSLTGNTGEQCLFILIGTGANGKSTFLNVLRNVFGDYAMQTPFSTFLQRNSDTVRSDIARMKGARFVCAVETNDHVRLDESLVKQLTGGDTVTARHLYQEYFEYIPEFKIFLAANYTPTIYGQDLAIWRRIKMVTFDVTIAEADRDPDLVQKLLEESSGILNWALQGCEEWQDKGLQTPEEVSAATAEYKSNQDILRDFVMDECIVGDEFMAPQANLFKAYKEWCAATDEKEIGKKSFFRNLEAKGHKKKVVKGVRYFTGVGLKSEFVG